VFGSKLAFRHRDVLHSQQSVHRIDENARHKTTAQSKIQGWKLRERKQRYQNAGVQATGNRNCDTILWGLENAAQASMDSQKNT